MNDQTISDAAPELPELPELPEASIDRIESAVFAEIAADRAPASGSPGIRRIGTHRLEESPSTPGLGHRPRCCRGIRRGCAHHASSTEHDDEHSGERR